MLDDFISEDMMAVRERPQMQMTTLSREVADREIFQIAQIDRQVGQCIAHRPGRIDDNTTHLRSVAGKVDQIIDPAP
jgi:hypothetical protein